MKPPKRARWTGALIESHLITHKTFHLFAPSFNFHDYVYFRSDCYWGRAEHKQQILHSQQSDQTPEEFNYLLFFPSLSPLGIRKVV